MDNGGLIRKVALPLEVFPVATVLFNLAQYVLALAVFFPAAIFFFRVALAWVWVFFLPILALQLLFTLGVCFMVSTATVFYRDVRNFTEILLTLLFWLTPIVYDIQTVPDFFKTVIYMNPLSYFILAYQEVLVYNTFPPIERLVAVFSLAAVSLALGIKSFIAYKVRFAEEV